MALYKVQFENGPSVQFEGDHPPTPQDLDYVGNQIGLHGPQQSKPGFFHSLVQSIAKPVIKTGVTAGKAVAGLAGAATYGVGKATGSQTLQGVGKEALQDAASPTAHTDFGYLGQVSPAKNVKEAVGTGLELGANLVGGEGAGTLAKTTVGGLVKQGITQGAKAGALAGGLAGTGSALNEDKGVGGVIGGGIEGALEGGAVGGAIGGIGAGVTRKLTGKGHSLEKIAEETGDPATKKNIIRLFKQTGKTTSVPTPQVPKNMESLVTQAKKYATPKEFVAAFKKNLDGDLPRNVSQEMESKLTDIHNKFVGKGGSPLGLKQGRFTGKISAIQAPQDLERAANVKDYVIPGKPVANVARLNQGAEDISENVVRPHLQANPRAYNFTTLNAKLRDQEIPLSIQSDANLAKTYDLVRGKLLEIAQKHPGNMEGLWDARKEFDQVIQREFGDLAFEDPRRVAVRKAILDMRRNVNNFISDEVGDDVFSQSMKKLSNMYEARDNIIEKNWRKFNSGSVKRLMSRHPVLFGGAVGIAGSAVAGGVYKAGRAAAESVAQ